MIEFWLIRDMEGAAVDRYEDLQPDKASGLLAKLETATAQVLAALTADHSQVPADYVAFMKELGWGEVGEAAYMLYEGLLTPDQVYDEDDELPLDGILLFGDDMQGYCSGFDTNNGWVVVDIDPVSREANQVADSFSEYIREMLNSL
ncbi:SMI1/KNR4 family protein [Pseudomonas sp. TE50-2]|uniref:SMI1/KNR4 family protein n=1 Tax=Pseudomonas sp. TE50-2 TaxID=3142707 RepID=UPI0034651E91